MILVNLHAIQLAPILNVYVLTKLQIRWTAQNETIVTITVDTSTHQITGRAGNDTPTRLQTPETKKSLKHNYIHVSVERREESMKRYECHTYIHLVVKYQVVIKGRHK